MLEGVFSLSKIRQENLSWPRDYHVMPAAGYFAGGDAADISRFDQATETQSVAASLREKKSSMSGSGNATYGYYTGGIAQALSNSIEKFAYMTSTTSTLGACLNQAKHLHAAVSSEQFGWHSGGLRDPNAQATTARIDRIDHVTDTQQVQQRCNLISFRSGHASVSERGTGWWLGGLQDPLGYPRTVLSSIEKLSHSTDTEMIASRAVLTVPRDGARAEHDGKSAYVCGGGDRSICQLDLATDTVSVSQAQNITAMSCHASTGDNQTAAWFVGTSLEKLSFATETVSTRHNTATQHRAASITNMGY